MEKAKILQLTNSCSAGGAEMHLLSLARYLNKEKYDITLAYFKEAPDDSRSLRNEFLKTGIRVIDLKCENKYNPLAVIIIARLMRKYRFDLVHTHLFQAELLGRMAMIFNKSPRVIVTYHNTEEFLKNRFWARMARYTTSRADQIITISDAVKNYLIDNVRVSETKIKMIYYGLEIVDSANNYREDIRSKNKIGRDDPLIGMIARYAPQKGHRFLLEAMTYVLKEVPEAKLFLAGHDEKKLKDSLEDYAKQLKIRPNVIFSEFQYDVYTLLREFDVFILSSLWEGFGLVLLEAMAAKKPIVASNVGPIPEIVIDNETGFLFPAKEPRIMAEKIILLLKNKELAKEMGRNGRRRLEEHFTIEKMIRETESVYDYWLNKK